MAYKSSLERRAEIAMGLIMDPEHHRKLGPAWQLYLRYHLLRNVYGNPWVCGMYPGRRGLSPLTAEMLSLLYFPVRTIERWHARLRREGYIVTVKVRDGFLVGILKCKEWRKGTIRTLPHPLVWARRENTKHGGIVSANLGGNQTYVPLRRRHLDPSPQDSNLYPRKKEKLLDVRIR